MTQRTSASGKAASTRHSLGTSRAGARNYSELLGSQDSEKSEGVTFPRELREAKWLDQAPMMAKREGFNSLGLILGIAFGVGFFFLIAALIAR